MKVFILLVFFSDHAVVAHFDDAASCEKAKAAVLHLYSAYIEPRAVCVPQGTYR